jgi:dipeptidyl aminopeptidase/acylaminoacyl peptidase
MRTLLIALLLFVSSFPVFAQSAPSKVEGRFDLTTPAKVVRVTDPQISPDGRTVAVLVGRVNYPENRVDTDVVLVDSATRTQRVLINGRRGVSSPRWTSDGSQLAFLAQVDGKAQVLAINVSGGEAWQVTKSPTPVINFAVRPDGKSVAFTAADEEPKREGEDRFNRSFEVSRSSFLATDVPRPVHLWLAPLDGAPAQRLTTGTWTLPAPFPPGPAPPAPSWSPDGKTVAFIRINSVHSGERSGSTIQLLDVERGSMRPLTTRQLGEQQPSFSPDGKSLAYWFTRPPSGNAIWIAPIEGGFGAPSTTTLDRHILRGLWMPDGKSLLLAANDHTTTGLWQLPLGGEPRRIEVGKLVANASYGLDASIGRDGRIVFTASEGQRPTELYLLASLTARPERLTDFNGHIAAMQLGKTETIEWKGADGFDMDGVITYPPDFQAGRKYPLVLYIHGGPRSTSKEAFSTRAQLLAAQGWIVFEPNYRGSDNHGGKFMSAIQNDAGAGPGRDVMSGIEQLKARGIVDEQRMAVSGWSYGGYMTTWMIGNYPETFKAAVAGAPVTDQLAQYTLSDGNSSRGQAGGSPYLNEQRMQSYVAQSPLTYAPKVKTPTLIMALTGDYRVPIPQAYSYFHALRDNGTKVQFIAYPLPGHSPTDPVHQRDVDRRWIEWIRTHLDAVGKTTTDGARLIPPTTPPAQSR